MTKTGKILQISTGILFVSVGGILLYQKYKTDNEVMASFSNVTVNLASLAIVSAGVFLILKANK